MIIYDDHAKCFGCGWRGDIFAFWQEVKGVDFKRAAEDLAGLAGVRSLLVGEADWLRSAARAPRPAVARVRKSPELPALDRLTEAEMEALADMRGLRVEGVRRAAAAGLLWGAVHQGHRAWVLADRARRNAQYRRMDGRRWYGEVKAWTAAGSWAAWPVGCVSLGSAERVAVVEGGPDALAMCDLMDAWGWKARDGAVVALFGASVQIAAWCLVRFQGRRVRIFAHNDVEKNGVRAGSAGAERWRRQLATVARSVDVVMAPDGLTAGVGAEAERVCDVNDVLLYDKTNKGINVTDGWRW